MADRRQGTPTVCVESAEKKTNTQSLPFKRCASTKQDPHGTDPTSNKATVLRRTACNVAIFHETSHTDLVCPMIIFPDDMANHYPKHKS